MIDPKKVSAVVVTKKANASHLPIAESLKCFKDVQFYDNSIELDRKVFGRYIGALNPFRDGYVYTQDDDCIIDAERLCAEYEPGELLCNLKPAHLAFYKPTGISLVGWGAIFPKAMIDFGPYLAKYPEDELFDRECDRIFTYLNRAKTRMVDIGVLDLPHALGADRMGTEARHGADLTEIKRKLGTL